MLDRVLYAIRRRVPDPMGTLASWRLSVVLTVSAALYYAFLAIWSTSSPPHVVQGISLLLPFWLLYALLLVNTALCLFRRLARLKKLLSGPPVFFDLTPRCSFALTPEADSTEVERRLARLGSGWKGPDETASFVRRRWSALGPFLFHGAFFVIALAVALTMLFRQETTFRVAEGEEFDGRPEQMASQSEPAPWHLPQTPMRFTIGGISPEFWGDKLLFTRLQAEIVSPGGTRRVTRINRPLWVGPATFLRLSGFGYAPRYELRDGVGRVVESLFVKLAVFPPGSRDGFRFETFPHQVDLEVLPDATEQDGRWVTRSLNLISPVISVRVSRGKLVLAQADLEAGRHVSFEGLDLTFPEIRYWGDFTVVRDPGAPPLFFGFLLAIVGLVINLRGGRAEARWLPGHGGKGGQLLVWGAVDPPAIVGLERDTQSNG